MLTAACTTLFAFAAMFAARVIVATLITYKPDVLALRACRHMQERPRYLVWRIVETGAPRTTASAAAIRAPRPWDETDLQAGLMPLAA